MIISVEELREHITTDKTDKVLEDMIQALELSIQGYTNNNFNRVKIEGEYPKDIKLGVINLLKWDLEKKVGIQSETISRHSVTYFNMDGENAVMGYPKSLFGFLKPYMRARF